MNARRGFVVALVSVLLVGPAATATSSPTSVHFTAAGDYGQTAATASVLQTVAAAAPDLHLALGDLSYGTTGAEQKWCDFVTAGGAGAERTAPGWVHRGGRRAPRHDGCLVIG